MSRFHPPPSCLLVSAAADQRAAEEEEEEEEEGWAPTITSRKRVQVLCNAER